MLKNINSPKIRFALIVCALASFSAYAGVPEVIQVEKYMPWSHPVKNVFNKNEVKLIKVSYGKNPNCLSFYVIFKFDPLTSTDVYFRKLYFDTFAANNYSSYSFVSYDDNLRINVDWKDKSKNILNIEMDNADSISMCEQKSPPP